jgi:adenylate cyclase class 2
MTTEIEAKFLRIDASALRASLRAAGATLEHEERTLRRRNFDHPDGRLEAIGGWVRIRDEGHRTTMSYKQLNDRTLHGTKEVDLVIDDGDKAEQFLLAIGLVRKSVQETRRESWKLGTCEVEIDTWPWIPSFAEIEGPDEASVRATCAALHLPWENALHGSVEVAYRDEYDVTEAEIDGWEEILFVPVPVWLEKTRRVR